MIPHWSEIYKHGLVGVRSVLGGNNSEQAYWRSNTFTTHNGNMVVIAREGHLLRELAFSAEHRILGYESDVLLFTFDRVNDTGSDTFQDGWGSGNGFLERLSGLFIPENVSIAGQERRWGRVKTENGITFNSIAHLLQQLDNASTIPRQKRILIDIRGNDNVRSFTKIIADIGLIVLSVIESVAKPIAAFFGIPPEAITIAIGVLRKVLLNQQVTLSELNPVLHTIVPASVRSVAEQGMNIYADIRRGNYVAAARALGVDTAAIGDFTRSVINGVEHSVLATARSFADVQKIQQATGIAKTIDGAIRGLRSGSYVADIIDNGIVNSKIVSDLLVNASSVQSFASAIPGIEKLIATVTREGLSDIAPVTHVALLDTVMGLVPNPDALKSISLSALTAQAAKFASQQLPFLLPAAVRNEWKSEFAQEIARRTGVTVVVGTPDGGSYATLPCAFC